MAWDQRAARQTSWHALSADEALAALEATAEGLSDAEASARLARAGANALPPAATASVLSILLAQFRSVIVVLLAAALVISLVNGDGVDAAAIGAVLILNAALGFVMELRARRAIEALGALDVQRATVCRGGALQVVDARTVVPGDVVEVTAGRQVPADARVIEAVDLRVDEAPLTGESMPVSKTPAPVPAETPLADRRSMVFKGTTVIAGRGRAVVSATGVSTEVGRIGTLVAGVTAEPTPLERKLDALGRRLVWATMAIAGIVAALGLVQGMPAGLVIEASIALAVAAVPEALPVVATIALAAGVHRMARRHALVRSLPAVEALGSTTVVCTDKTRTLTSGRMAVVRVWIASTGQALELARDDGRAAAPDAGRDDPTKAGARAVLAAAARASLPQAAGGGAYADPVDAAVLAAIASDDDAGSARESDELEPAGLVPFSSARKRLAVFTRDQDGALTAWVKGGPRAVLDICSRVDAPGGARALDEAAATSLLEVNERLARDGLRVLGVASGPVDGPTEEHVRGLTFRGFIGLADPPAAGVPETVARLRRAGLRTVMLTGDQRLTAEAVGRAVGVLDAGGRAIEGRDLDALAPEALAEAVASTAAFTRVTPEHKLRIVRALQDRGEIVAMLGDGINDAAALEQADIGVAMGIRGTDVAKQAAAIVLQDDRFETVAAAVEEGRVIFDNIQTFVFYLFSCNVAEILVLLLATLAGLPLPVLPLQLLWLNLVTDTFPALSLAMEPAASDVLARPPRRPDEAMLTGRFFRSVGIYAALITAATLAAFLWALANAPGRATSVAFMTLGLAQIAHLGTARRRNRSAGDARSPVNRYAIGAVVVSVALQAIAVYVPALARILHARPLGLGDWLVVAACAAVPALAGRMAIRLRRRP